MHDEGGSDNGFWGQGGGSRGFTESQIPQGGARGVGPGGSQNLRFPQWRESADDDDDRGGRRKGEEEEEGAH